jgi:hypothetical protein
MPTPTYTPLATTRLTSTATSVTFSSIPATYRDLVLVVLGQASISNAEPRFRFNGDTSSSYSFVAMRGNGSSASSNSGSATFGYFDPLNNYVGSSQTLSTLQIMDYSTTNKHKIALLRFGRASGGTGASATGWPVTSAITSISCFTNGDPFAIGSTFSLYGIIS